MANTKSLEQQNIETWVMSRTNRNHGLLPIRSLLNQVGNPQDQIQTIHIAGTNGKGSTTNYLKEILVAHGYRVGMFTSPHLITHRDRIRINEQIISEEEFARYVFQYKKEIEELDLGMFEIDCLVAFLWFQKEKVDYALIETGLGGRYDNTNVIQKPLLEIITTIGYDHMNILGNRLEQITFEKAGIIQKGTTCVLGYLNPKVYPIIERKAQRQQANLIRCPKVIDQKQQTFLFDQDVYKISSYASYQIHNAALALESAWILGIPIHDEQTKNALQQANWLGRFEVMQKEPLIIIDGAHNEEGMNALVESFAQLPKPITVVYSALKDKPGKQMANRLKENCETLIVTQFVNARADTVEDLEVEGCITISNWQDAIQYAKKNMNVKGTLVITGSLYFISLVRPFLKGK